MSETASGAGETGDTAVATVRVREDGVLEYRYKPHADVTLERAQELLAAAREILQGRGPLPTLVAVGAVKAVSRDARVYFAEGEQNQAISTRVALVVSSPTARVLGNFFMGLNTPVIPTRLFNDEAIALAWLAEG